MSNLTKVTNTSLNIGKILDVLEKDNATLNEIVHLTRVIDMTINNVQRFMQRNLRDNDYELDFTSMDLDAVAVCADIYIDKFRKDILLENALNDFKDKDEVGSTIVDDWTKRLVDTLYVIKTLTHLSNMFHYLSAISSLLENEEDDFNSAAIMAIKEYLRKS